jgi:hypothetical protein
VCVCVCVCVCERPEYKSYRNFGIAVKIYAKLWSTQLSKHLICTVMYLSGPYTDLLLFELDGHSIGYQSW